MQTIRAKYLHKAPLNMHTVSVLTPVSSLQVQEENRSQAYCVWLLMTNGHTASQLWEISSTIFMGLSLS